MNKLYEKKLDKIKADRERTMQYAETIEEVQRKMYSSLTNVESGLRNGKTLLYISKKIPKIFDNLKEATTLAAGKPYLLAVAKENTEIMVGRIIKLQAYLKDFVLKADDKTLLNPLDRDKFVWEVYQDINIIYALSESMVSMFKMYNLQDAIDKVVPYKLYYNMDKIIVNDIRNKLKF